MTAALTQGEKPFYFDAGWYWALSDAFIQHGHFSLLNFHDPLRGYALPFAYYVLRKVGAIFTGSDSLMVMCFNAAAFALIGSVLAPQLARIVWPRLHWGVRRRLALSALILVFWSGYLVFPLSDFPAFAAALLALVAISTPNSLPTMLVAGVSIGLAMDFRPAYLPLVPVLVGLALWDWAEHRSEVRASHIRRAACLGLFVAGLTLVSLPQSLSNHRATGNYNPIPGGSSLAGLQYTGGLRLQRYDTFVGNLDEARVNYLDPHTSGILRELKNESVRSSRQYLEIIVHHPVIMAGVFLRHIVNGLDLRYRSPYVERLNPHWNHLWRFAGFLLVFLALVRLCWPTARRALQPARWRYLIALLPCSATAIPSAVETRFMLPVFTFCAMVVTAPGWVSSLESAAAGKRRYRAIALIAGAAVLFYAIVWTIVSGASANLQLGAT